MQTDGFNKSTYNLNSLVIKGLSVIKTGCQQPYVNDNNPVSFLCIHFDLSFFHLSVFEE